MMHVAKSEFCVANFEFFLLISYMFCDTCFIWFSLLLAQGMVVTIAHLTSYEKMFLKKKKRCTINKKKYHHAYTFIKAVVE